MPDLIEGRASEPWKHAYTSARTLINNLAEHRQIAWINAAIWPPVGGVVELGPPNRDAIVLGVRLILPASDEQAVILVDVQEPEGEEFVPRHPVDRDVPEE